MPLSTDPRISRSRLPGGHVFLDTAADRMALAPAAHLVTPRRRYVHHGIYVGAGRVIHYAGLCDSLKPLPIEDVGLDEFTDGRMLAWLPSTPRRFSAEVVVARARSRLGEDAYDLLRNNCEHFCHWCLDGRPRSEQVERFLALPSRLVERVLGTPPLRPESQVSRDSHR